MLVACIIFFLPVPMMRKSYSGFVVSLVVFLATGVVSSLDDRDVTLASSAIALSNCSCIARNLSFVLRVSTVSGKNCLLRAKRFVSPVSGCFSKSLSLAASDISSRSTMQSELAVWSGNSDTSVTSYSFRASPRACTLFLSTSINTVAMLLLWMLTSAAGPAQPNRLKTNVSTDIVPTTPMVTNKRKSIGWLISSRKSFMVSHLSMEEDNHMDRLHVYL